MTPAAESAEWTRITGIYLDQRCFPAAWGMVRETAEKELHQLQGEV